MPNYQPVRTYESVKEVNMMGMGITQLLCRNARPLWIFNPLGALFQATILLSLANLNPVTFGKLSTRC